MKAFNSCKVLLTHSLSKNKKILNLEWQKERENTLLRDIFSTHEDPCQRNLLFHSLKHFTVNILGWISNWPDFYLLNVKVFLLSFTWSMSVTVVTSLSFDSCVWVSQEFIYEHLGEHSWTQDSLNFSEFRCSPPVITRWKLQRPRSVLILCITRRNS